MRAKPTTPSQPGALRSGFTLVEIMAVMAVIAILLSVAAVGIQNIDRGQATTTATAVTEALFDEARSAAIGRGTRSRLVIHNDLNDEDPNDRIRYLSYMCVAILETDEDGAQGNQWRVIKRGTQLPAGVYFSEEDSFQAAKKIEVGRFGKMSIELPGDRSPKKCIYYEFNAEGVCRDGEDDSAEPGAAVVLVGGARQRGAKIPQIRGKNKVGFVLWRNGRTSLFRNPDQIEDR